MRRDEINNNESFGNVLNHGFQLKILSFSGKDNKSYFKPLQANQQGVSENKKRRRHFPLAKSLFIITLNKVLCWILLNEINNFRKNAH